MSLYDIFILIISDWGKFTDIDGNDSIQYSLAGVYIISLNVVKDNSYSSKEYASNFMYQMLNSSEVTDVNGATVKIGKNNEYNAYQVYMYYPNDNVYLITYWFEAEDNKTHYIALEGPGKDLDKYLSIPNSFYLKK